MNRPSGDTQPSARSDNTPAAGRATASGPARKLSYMSNQAPSEMRARNRRWKRLGGRRSRRAATSAAVNGWVMAGGNRDNEGVAQADAAACDWRRGQG